MCMLIVVYTFFFFKAIIVREKKCDFVIFFKTLMLDFNTKYIDYDKQVFVCFF